MIYEHNSCTLEFFKVFSPDYCMKSPNCYVFLSGSSITIVDDIFQEVTAELLVEHIKKHKDAAAFVVEGYPRDKSQMEEFNKCVSTSSALNNLKKILQSTFNMQEEAETEYLLWYSALFVLVLLCFLNCPYLDSNSFLHVLPPPLYYYLLSVSFCKWEKSNTFMSKLHGSDNVISLKDTLSI